MYVISWLYIIHLYKLFEFSFQPATANSLEDPTKHVGESLKSSLVLFSTDDQRMKTQVNKVALTIILIQCNNISSSSNKNNILLQHPSEKTILVSYNNTFNVVLPRIV